MKKVFVVLVLAFAQRTSAQENVGTIIILLGSQQKIVIAADSRKVALGVSGKMFVKEDTECKVVALKGNLVFATSGRVAFLNRHNPQLTWDARDIARRVASTLRPASNSTKSFAKIWSRQVIAMHNRDSRAGVISPNNTAKNEIESAFFAGVEDGHLIAYGVSIVKAPKIQGIPQAYNFEISEPLRLESGSFYPIGTLDIPSEYGAMQSPRSKVWHTEFSIEHVGQDWNAIMPEFAERIIELTETYSIGSNEIGGPTDIVEISPNGIRWIKRKHECQ